MASYNAVAMRELEGAAAIEALRGALLAMPRLCVARLTLGHRLVEARREEEAARAYADCYEACRQGLGGGAGLETAGACANNLALLLEPSAGRDPDAWGRILALYAGASGARQAAWRECGRGVHAHSGRGAPARVCGLACELRPVRPRARDDWCCELL